MTASRMRRLILSAGAMSGKGPCEAFSAGIATCLALAGALTLEEEGGVADINTTPPKTANTNFPMTRPPNFMLSSLR
jgi:uncharacterized OsmC-like protein